MSFLIDATGSQQMILIFGSALVAIYIMAKIMRKSAQGPDKSLTTEEQIERLRQSRGMHGDLEKLMIEIEELAQRWGKRLDQKAVQMDRLLEEADAKIAELKRLRGEASETRPRDAFVREDQDGKDEREPRGPRVIRPAGDTPEPRLRMAREDDFAPPRAQPMPAAPPREQTIDPLAASVYKLADAGHAPMEIARKLNEEIGKVELILALRRA